MRTINLRQFQRNLSQEVKDLPITVTKDNTPVFIVAAIPTVPVDTNLSPSTFASPPIESVFSTPVEVHPSFISKLRKLFKRQ